MIKFLNWLKHKLPNRQMFLRALSVVLVMSFFVTYVSFAISKQDILLPTNPLDDSAIDNSEVHLLGGQKELVHADEIPEEQQENADEQDEEQDEQIEPDDKDDVDEEKEDDLDDQKEETENAAQNETEDTQEEQEEQEQQKLEEDDVDQPEKQIDQADDETAKQDPQQDEKKNPNKTNKDKETTKPQDDTDSNKDTDKNEDQDTDKKTDKDIKQNTEKDKNDEQQGTGEGEDDQDATDIEVTEDDEEDEENEEEDVPKDANEFFTTSIKDGATVTEESYSFAIEQHDHDYNVDQVNVSTNPKNEGVELNKTNDPKITRAKLTLTENENEIRVSVTYKDNDDETFTVSRTYIVHLEKEKIIIQSDLEDGQVVHRENLSFRAYANLGSDKAPVTVTLNSKEVDKSRRDNYVVKLQEGKNKLTIESDYKGQSVKEEYTVDYEKPKINIDTNLQNKTVDQDKLTFTAKAQDGKGSIDLSVTHGKTTITENDQGNYAVTLSEGKNYFNLTATKGDVVQSDTYTVIFNPHASEGGSDDDNENEPAIEVFDLKDGQTLKSLSYTFHVRATSYLGESLTSDGSITAKNNGNPIKVNWVDSDQISFTMNVESGDNKIAIEAKDNEGNSATKKLMVHGHLADEGEAVGKVNVSVEASTIGLGYLIEPEEVEVYQGENAVGMIDRLFKEHGYTYEHTGSSDNSFYLEEISKEGFVKNPVIPKDLAERLERDMSWFDPDDYSPDILGEFHFTNGSGWMYSVNGNYPNVGFADFHFKDGDEVRIRFTLSYGSDIGGGMPGNNYGKEW